MEHENKPYSLVRNIKSVYILAFSVVSVFYVMSVVAISYYERKAGVEHQVEDLSSFVLGYYSHFGSIYYEDLKIGLATSRVQESLRKEDYKDLEKMIIEHQLARSSDFVVLLDDSEVKFAVNRYNYRVYSQLLESLSDPGVISKIQAKREILIVYSGRVISAANIALEGGNTDLSILVFSEVTSSLLKEYTSFMSHRFYFENINSSLDDIE
ncbi:hypothetical protein RCJ22_27380, partial [Vibrio sp. FNV 38]|nr:hypothetical protein [Vibrio sp. FNV 38]